MNCRHKQTKMVIGTLAVPSDPLAGFKGPTSKGREGGEGEEWEGEEWEGEEWEGNSFGPQSGPPNFFVDLRPCNLLRK